MRKAQHLQWDCINCTWLPVIAVFIHPVKQPLESHAFLNDKCEVHSVCDLTLSFHSLLTVYTGGQGSMPRIYLSSD